MSADPPTVLIVEDDPDLADLYATWLGDDYDARVAYSGMEALERLDEDTDVVLLDRRMPGLAGDEALAEIGERGYDCRVAMVTAVEPDFDIVAMGFDDYLVKPVSEDALHRTVSNLLLRTEYDEGIRELFSLASKKALLESEKTPSELADSEEYGELDRRLDERRSELNETVETLARSEDVGVLYNDLSPKFDGDGENI